MAARKARRLAIPNAPATFTVPDEFKASLRTTSQLFGVAQKVITDWTVKGLPYLQRGEHGRHWQFDLRACVKWYAESIQAPRSSTDPDELTPSDRKSWFDSELKHRELQVRDGELILAETFRVTLADCFKNLVATLENAIDVAERDHNLDPEQLDSLATVITALRAQMHQAVLDAAAE